MRRGVGHVNEKRLVTFVFANVTRGVVADGVGIIKLIRFVSLIRERRNLRVLARERVGIKKTARAVDGSIKAIEPPLARPIIFWAVGTGVRGHVPFAGHISGVTSRLHYLGNRTHILPEITAIAWQVAIVHHVADARLMRVHPREQRGPRGAATAGVIKLRKPHAAAGEGIEVGRFDFAAVTADVAPAHVIGHRDDDVGPRRFGCENSLCKQAKAHDKKKDAIHAVSLPNWRNRSKRIGLAKSAK